MVSMQISALGKVLSETPPGEAYQRLKELGFLSEGGLEQSESVEAVLQRVLDTWPDLPAPGVQAIDHRGIDRTMNGATLVRGMQPASGRLDNPQRVDERQGLATATEHVTRLTVRSFGHDVEQSVLIIGVDDRDQMLVVESDQPRDILKQLITDRRRSVRVRSVGQLQQLDDDLGSRLTVMRKQQGTRGVPSPLTEYLIRA